MRLEFDADGYTIFLLYFIFYLRQNYRIFLKVVLQLLLRHKLSAPLELEALDIALICLCDWL